MYDGVGAECSLSLDNMMTPNIRFDLWPDGAFDQQDVTELQCIISSIDSVSGDTSHDFRGLDVQTTIEFVSLVVVGHFIGKIVDALYEKAKVGFAKTLTKPIEESKHQIGGIIWMYTNIDKIRVCIICRYDSDECIYRFLDKANTGLSWLHDRIENGEINIQQEGRIELIFVDKKEGDPSDCRNGKLLYEARAVLNGQMTKTYSCEI